MSTTRDSNGCLKSSWAASKAGELSTTCVVRHGTNIHSSSEFDFMVPWMPPEPLGHPAKDGGFGITFVMRSGTNIHKAIKSNDSNKPPEPFQSKFNELFKNINGHFHVSLHSTPALCTLKMIINNLVQNKRKTEIQSDTLKNFGISRMGLKFTIIGIFGSFYISYYKKNVTGCSPICKVTNFGAIFFDIGYIYKCYSSGTRCAWASTLLTIFLFKFLFFFE